MYFSRHMVATSTRAAILQKACLTPAVRGYVNRVVGLALENTVDTANEGRSDFLETNGEFSPTGVDFAWSCVTGILSDFDSYYPSQYGNKVCAWFRAQGLTI